MKLYKRPYFIMFSAVCSCIEILERIVKEENISLKSKQIIISELDKLKFLQQKSEEFIIND